MSKKALTTDKLLRTIRRKAFIPSDDDSYTDEDLIEMMNNEMDVFLATEIISKYEEYLVTKEDVALVQNTYTYDIPSRAAGNKLRDIFYVQDPTVEFANQVIYEMHRIDLPDHYAYQGSRGFTSWDEQGFSYMLEDNNVKLLNDFPVSSGSLRMYYYMQPSMMVKESEVGKITAIDRDTGIITMSNFPTDFSGLVTEGCDFVKYKSPHNILGYDITVSAVSSSMKTVTISDPDTIPSDLAVGDYLTATQETPVPNVPTELHSVLAQLVAISVAEGLNDEQAKQSLERQLSKMEKSLSTILNDRVDGSNKKIVNRHSTLSQQRGGFNKSGY